MLISSFLSGHGPVDIAGAGPWSSAEDAATATAPANSRADAFGGDLG
jgi:hypothetical protein